MFRFIFCTAIASSLTTIYAQNHTQEQTFESDELYYQNTLRHIEGRGIGYKEGYTTFQTFLAKEPSQSIITPFLDARGHRFNRGKWAANIGAGLRSLWKNRIYGFNTFYDYRNTGHLHVNQVGVGFENIGEFVDFRLNGYLPVGTRISRPYDNAFVAFRDHYMVQSQKRQVVMRGVEAELGFHLGAPIGMPKSFELYAAAGPYCFKGKRETATWGAKARLSGCFKDTLTLEIISSYDSTFHSTLQGQISLNFPLDASLFSKDQESASPLTTTLNRLMLQPVGRQEIIAVDTSEETLLAINPSTGLPYFFVFVDNTSASEGTYESPYHSLAQAQDNSNPHDIIYVFPGDGTTHNMDVGITLQDYQKFWGSGTNHNLQTSTGLVSIPAQTSALPIITNTDTDSEGNAITLATHNTISGFSISSPLMDGIYGNILQDLEVSSCTFTGTPRFTINASFFNGATISLTNNHFLNNVNGVFLALNGRSTVFCSNNTFTGQSSVSSIPLEISASTNSFTAHIENNLFDSNTTGGIRFDLNYVNSATIDVLNNTITNSGTGSTDLLGSNFVIYPSGTTDYCALTLKGNTFNHNAGNAVYFFHGGAFGTLEAALSQNTVSNGQGSGFTFASQVDNFTLIAKNNRLTNLLDNGISVIAAGTTSRGDITISHNLITDIENQSNGIAINQAFSNLNLSVQNNIISRCDGTGLLSYAPTGIDHLALNIFGNTISDCQNNSSNAASGIDIEQYKHLEGTISHNTLSDNAGRALVIDSALSSPTVNLKFRGNRSTNYLLSNPVNGLFNISPRNPETVNTGEISISGDIQFMDSLPE